MFLADFNGLNEDGRQESQQPPLGRRSLLPIQETVLLALFLGFSLFLPSVNVAQSFDKSFQIVNLGTLTGGNTVASALNNRGHVVGNEASGAGFLWDGDMQRIGNPLLSNVLKDINDYDQYVGYAHDLFNYYPVSSSAMTILRSIPRTPDYFLPTAINNRGQICGEAGIGGFFGYVTTFLLSDQKS